MSDPIARLNAALEGRYAIERELGEGGMATVYLTKDLKHNRNVALKVLKPELAAVVGAERFLAEIETTANLTHPHILPLHDSGEADGFLFYVMPHIEGESLRERIDREKQLGVDDALAITQKVAGALDYAHEHGVVHRDIKPGNILLSAQGEPLIADFGIALAVAQAGGGRITETGLSLGTPHYMSPEQATGDRDVDPRSDVYALGCVLYEMLAGQPPFSATTAQAVLVKILTADPPSITSERRTVPPHVAYNGTEPGGTAGTESDIYTYNVALRTAPRRLTFEGENRYPVWSPDGTRVTFASIREGTDASDLFVKTVNDDSAPQMIVTLPGAQIPNQWPSDDLVVFESGGASDLWMVDLSSDSAVARPYLESEADLYYLMVSADRDLAAYTSDEAGRPEVYVRSFPDARQPDILSQGGGRFPLWSPDGNTIYYWTLGETSAVKSLIATTIERGPPFVVISRDTVLTGAYRSFDSHLHPDGDRLVISQSLTAEGANATADDALETRFLIVTNFFEELRERAPN